MECGKVRVDRCFLDRMKIAGNEKVRRYLGSVLEMASSYWFI
jgi:hypothetical protein